VINRFFKELHRRHVFRTLAYYVVAGWLLLQAADVLFPAWDIPESGIRYVLYAVVLGFPVALLFAWFYDVGPEGLKRTAVVHSGEVQPLRGRDFLLLGALVAVLGAIVFGTLKDVDRDASPPEERMAEIPAVADPDPPMVAVLPFAASGSDEDSLLFADGVHQDLLTQLSRLDSLRVISRSSVMPYRDEVRNIQQIGKALGAAVILEGLVRVAGDQIRINAQLIDARSDENLWSETFDRSLTTANLFEVQADIARAISAALDAELSETEASDLSVVPTSNMAAYRVFKRATRGFGSNLGKPEFIADMERAVELDPEFVQAWAELAGAYAFISRQPDRDREDMLQRAEAALGRIEQLSPGSVEHLYAQAYYLYYALQEYEAALAMTEQAIERKPSDLRLHQLKSWIERRLGLFDQRVETMQRLIALDPLTEQRSQSLAYQLYLLHRYDEAWAKLGAPPPGTYKGDFQASWVAALLRNRHAGDFGTFLSGMRSDLDMDELVGSSHPRAQIYLWQLAYAGRDYEQALRIIETLPTYPGWESVPVSGEATLSIPVLWAMGDSLRFQAVVTEAQERLERIVADRPEIVSDPIYLQDLALLAFARGDEAEAAAMLERWEVVSQADWNHRMQFREAVCGTWGMMARTVEAVACLRRGFDEPSQMVPWMAPFQSEYDLIRETPAFQALLAELQARFGSLSKTLTADPAA
jgi:TolB-like protein